MSTRCRYKRGRHGRSTVAVVSTKPYKKYGQRENVYARYVEYEICPGVKMYLQPQPRICGLRHYYRWGLMTVRTYLGDDVGSYAIRGRSVAAKRLPSWLFTSAQTNPSV